MRRARRQVATHKASVFLLCPRDRVHAGKPNVSARNVVNGPIKEPFWHTWRLARTSSLLSVHVGGEEVARCGGLLVGSLIRRSRRSRCWTCWRGRPRRGWRCCWSGSCPGRLLGSWHEHHHGYDDDYDCNDTDYHVSIHECSSVSL